MDFGDPSLCELLSSFWFYLLRILSYLFGGPTYY